MSKGEQAWAAGNAEERRLHMVGNAHIDPVWLWRWPEGLEAARATFRSALDRMEEFPDFIFSCSSAAVYQWIERTDPALFTRIRRAVATGRWCLVGGWWVEPDCNLPSGESLARQGLYGQRYFREKFGRTAWVGYNVDSFGHSGMMPQILAKSGLSCYVFMRPMATEIKLPTLFWWESADGARVLAYRIPVGYNLTCEDIGEEYRRLLSDVETDCPDLMLFYGVGNHGGGPTVKTLRAIQGHIEAARSPQVEFSSPERYFAAVSHNGAAIPTIWGELAHVARGCYAAMSEIKRNNRLAENVLLAAEKFATVAAALGLATYPAAELRQAWQDTLFNQFHDILAGTCIPEAYEDARNLHGRAIQLGTEQLNYALQTLAARIGTKGADPALIVFNPHSWTVKAPVEFRPPLDGLLDEEGGEILCQRFEDPNHITSREKTVAVLSAPPMGYCVYRGCATRQAGTAAGRSVNVLRSSGTFAENDFFRLELDPHDGVIRALYDKRYGIHVFRGRAAVPLVVDDPSDTWSHGVARFGNVIGRFRAAEVSLLESGPVRVRLRAESRYRRSTLRQDFLLYQELPYIECRVEVDWRESYKALKLAFPVRVEADVEVTSEIPFGTITRPADGGEEPCQNWVDLSGSVTAVEGVRMRYGVSIVNNGKYSYDTLGTELRLTVLRSPSYADHETAGRPPVTRYRSIDQGFQSFKYLIFPHRGDWREAGTVKLGWELNQPLIGHAESGHDGDLPPNLSYLTVDPPEGVILSALKDQEDARGLILRAYEAHGVQTRTTWRLGCGRTWMATFKPYEIKTFLIPAMEEREVVEVDLLEDEPLQEQVDGGVWP